MSIYLASRTNLQQIKLQSNEQGDFAPLFLTKFRGMSFKATQEPDDEEDEGKDMEGGGAHGFES